MSRASQKIRATTQKFIEIESILDDIVLLSGGLACLVLEIIVTNFSLQSKEEQQSKILSYASLLNSLSFPIQIVILSRKLDIGRYIKLLEQEAQRTANQTLSSHIMLYKNFVSELVKNNTVLDKKFYIVFSYSFLEKGPGGVASMTNKEAFINDARTMLHSKAKSVIQELLRIGLKSKILKEKELINVYYEIYNSEAGGVDMAEGASAPIVRSL